jgi:hypothetical protein
MDYAVFVAGGPTLANSEGTVLVARSLRFYAVATSKLQLNLP